MEIRYAVQDDIPFMGRVYVDTWKAAYQGMIPQEFLDGLSTDRWESSYHKSLDVLGMPKAAVLTEDEQVIGVSSFSKTRDADLSQEYGEIISIYVLPAYWHKGYGKQLLAWVTGELKSMGFHHCALWTLEENTRAQRAYEHFGFTRDGSRKIDEISGRQVWEVRYRMPL